jgi:hypothetical protein
MGKKRAEVMKIHDVRQGEPEWFAARRGVITASEIDALVTPLWKVRTGEGVHTYLHLKLAERIMNYSKAELTGGAGWAAEQGNIVEKIARPFYECITGEPIRTVGFVTTDDERCGCSPDGLLGQQGGIEIKAPQPPTHLKYLLAGEVPPEYRAQVQFSLWVTKRDYWTFMSFYAYPHILPPLILRVEPDRQAFAAFEQATSAFIRELDAATAKVRGMMTQGGRA